MNNIVWQLGCVVLLFLSVMWNRAVWGDPKLPLLGLAASIGLWVLVALYVLASNLWSVCQGKLADLAVFSISPLTILSTVLAMIPLVGLVLFLVKAKQMPPIHDISTDTRNPPEFVLAKQERHSSHNPLVYAAKNAELQRQAYEEVQPLLVSTTPSAVIVVAEAVVTELGWEIVGINKEEGGIEARATTSLLRFVDDIIIRVKPTSDGGSRIDVRSASRVGVSDLGANAQRIQLFFDALSPKLASLAE